METVSLPNLQFLPIFSTHWLREEYKLQVTMNGFWFDSRAFVGIVMAMSPTPLLLIRNWPPVSGIFHIQLIVYFLPTAETFFYRKSTIGTTKAAIEANNGTYCLRKRIEKFPLIAISKKIKKFKFKFSSFSLFCFLFSLIYIHVQINQTRNSFTWHVYCVLRERTVRWITNDANLPNYM